MNVTTAQAREIAIAIALIADRTDDEPLRLFRAIRGHLEMEPDESREVGFQLMAPDLVREKHFAVRTGEIAEALNDSGRPIGHQPLYVPQRQREFSKGDRPKPKRRV